MSHVSRAKVKPVVERRIRDHFLRAILAGSKRRGHAIFEEILTPTEKTMLAKRLAILLMLSSDMSYYRISKTLKVSTSTIKRLHRKMQSGSYREISKLTQTTEDAVVRFLEKILAFRMPPKAGPGRWKFLDERRS